MTLQQRGKALVGQQDHVFGKHGKQTAHEEVRHGLAVMPLLFERAPRPGQKIGDVARDLGGLFGGVDAQRLVPNGAQAFKDLGLAQVAKADLIAAAVGELRVAMTGEREIGPNLQGLADVHDEQEGRPAVFFGHRARVFVRLPLGLHKHTGEGRGAALAVHRTRPLVRALHALLGLPHKSAAPVQINAPCPAVGVVQGSFKAIMIGAALFLNRQRPIDAQHVPEFLCKHLR